MRARRLSRRKKNSSIVLLGGVSDMSKRGSFVDDSCHRHGLGRLAPRVCYANAASARARWARGGRAGAGQREGGFGDSCRRNSRWRHDAASARAVGVQSRAAEPRSAAVKGWAAR